MGYYRIHLQAVSPFFFGTELKAELGNRQNYFQTSRMFPQQTTLLGMLRHQLLLQKGYIPINAHNRDKVNQLIGRKSFQYEASNKQQKDFGVIQHLSPVLLAKEEADYFVADKNFVRKEGQQTELLLEFQEDHQDHFFFPVGVQSPNLSFLDEKEREIIPPTTTWKKSLVRYKYAKEDFFVAKHPFIPLLRDYKTKTYLANKTKKQTLDNIFHTVTKVGIDKKETSEKDSAGYFKMSYQQMTTTKPIKPLEKDTPFANTFAQYVLSDAWGFGFYVALKEEATFKFDTTTRFVTMGKEQSVFKMTIQSLEEKPYVFVENDDPELSTNQLYRITLISDTFVPDEQLLYQHCVFGNVDSIRFRNIVTNTTDERSYYAQPRKSAAFNLLKRGSLLYLKKDQLEAVKCILNHRQDFKKIGYNHFIIEPQNTNS
ncbi:MAG: type III-B CRISPR module-associated Cmr3 family protein [Bacteroidota bacterium]